MILASVEIIAYFYYANPLRPRILFCYFIDYIVII